MLRPFRTWIALLATMVLFALAVGCARDADATVVVVRAWTLEAPGKTPRDVILPAHFDADLPRERSRYFLRATVPIAPAWRGRPLTLAVPHFLGIASLRVNDEPARSLESHLAERYRSPGVHSWAIASEQTSHGEVRLEISVDHAWIPSAWFDTPPRLSPTLAGDATFLAVSEFNHWSATLLLGMTLTLFVVYLSIFLFDRRRPTYGWFALQACTSLQYAVFTLGLTQPVFGVWEGPANKLILVAGGFGSVAFAHSYFGLGRAPRAFAVGAMAVVASSLPVAVLFAAGKFGPLFVVPEMAAGALWAAIGCYQIFLLRRVLRKGDQRADAWTLSIGWIAWSICTAPELVAWVGLGEPLGGLHLTALGLVIFGFLQAGMLSRAHIVSRKRADDLNTELAGRVAMLESSNEEVQMLNEELRRQVAARSRALADALSRIGGVAERSLSIAVGDVIQGRYRVVRALGSGGMGSVYEVERSTDRRRLALKMMHGADSGASLARFAREAEIAAQMSHTNLVSIVDVDVSEDGALFTVMELVVGTPLAEERGRFGDEAWVVPILAQIAAGLAALHDRGIVHRDLKPGNVLLTRGEGGAETAKIADFGIARLPNTNDFDSSPPGETFAQGSAVTSSGSDSRGSAGSSPALTKSGVLMGTPLYMAPELARGAKEAQPSSDIWSFGVMAYEILTARFPFSITAPPVIDAFAGRAFPAPSRPQVTLLDERAIDLLLRCLDAVPSKRPSASELVDAMRAHGDVPMRARA